MSAADQEPVELVHVSLTATRGEYHPDRNKTRHEIEIRSFVDDRALEFLDTAKYFTEDDEELRLAFLHLAVLLKERQPNPDTCH